LALRHAVLTHKLEQEAGTLADPPTFHTAVPNAQRRALEKESQRHIEQDQG